MKVLLIGAGGREHSLCWKINQSAKVDQVFCAPGNAGTAQIATNIPLGVQDVDALVEYARENEIGLTVVGPELPLSLGIVDAFERNGLEIFGASKEAAKLESSKSFAKQIMHESGVKTASYEVFDNQAEAFAHLDNVKIPLVIKVDGLASGKGVFVCFSREEAEVALKQVYLAKSEQQVVIEEYLEGVEASYIVAISGDDVIPLASSHDYKRIGEQGTGPNTGGMGAVSPTDHLSPDQEVYVLEQVIRPVMLRMKERGTPFQGFLYAGLMINPTGDIHVLEFNVRLGDPECQAILRRLDSDFVELLMSLTTEGVESSPLVWKEEGSVCLVLAAEGYPEEPVIGDEIIGLELAESMPGIVVFQAGTNRDEKGRLLTAGGRVLNVTATGTTVDEARSRAYKAADMIQFRGRQMRRDIGRS